MSSLHTLYLQLIKDTRLLIDSQIHRDFFLFRSEREQQECLPPKVKQEETPLTVSPSITTVTKEAYKLPKYEKEKPKAQIKQGTWDLQPMFAVEQPSTFYKKLVPHIPICMPSLQVLLVLPEENAAHRLLLENLSRAITRLFAPARVTLFHKTLFKQHQAKWLLAPLSILKSHFPNFLPHQPHKTEHVTWIPLESLDLYLIDVHAKRALWKAIQLSFQS
jgi:hypothetical protein